MYCLEVREMGVLVAGKALRRLYRVYRSVERAETKTSAKVRSKESARRYHQALDSRVRRRSDGVRVRSLVKVSIGLDRGRSTARAPVHTLSSIWLAAVPEVVLVKTKSVATEGQGRRYLE
jgi:hypothetical protein